MFSRLIATIDDPAVALGLLAALDETVLFDRLLERAEVLGRPVAEVVAGAVNAFVENASRDRWSTFVTMAVRANDLDVEGLKAILYEALP